MNTDTFTTTTVKLKLEVPKGLFIARCHTFHMNNGKRNTSDIDLYDTVYLDEKGCYKGKSLLTHQFHRAHCI